MQYERLLTEALTLAVQLKADGKRQQAGEFALEALATPANGNRYTYTPGDDPINNIDPTGLFWRCGSFLLTLIGFVAHSARYLLEASGLLLAIAVVQLVT